MSEQRRTIAVDAMGSDLGPEEIAHGVKIALQQGHGLDGVVMVGKEEVLNPILAKLQLDRDPRVTVFNASEVIGMDEKPIQSLKSKKDASMVRTVELVKLGTCAAAVSCGNTGALMACATLRLRPMEGVSKPALATVWPSKDNHFILLDAGANPQCKPENLVHYAILGHHYAKDAIGLDKPRVGLLTIGTEEGKGTDLVNEAHRLLRGLGEQINYIGPVEGFQFFTNEVDVIVTDGFTGNVALKSCESLWKMLKALIKEEAKVNPLRMAGALAAAPLYKGVRGRLDPDRYGGAPLLGLQGNVLKAHGSANRNAIAAAVGIAARVVQRHLTQHCRDDIAVANERVRSLQDGARKKD